MLRAGGDWQVWAEGGSSGGHPMRKAAQGVPEDAFLVPLPCSPRISALRVLTPAQSRLFSRDAAPVGPQVSPSGQPPGKPCVGGQGKRRAGQPHRASGMGSVAGSALPLRCHQCPGVSGTS